MTLMSSRILVLPSLQELEELLCTSFLKKTHQRTPDRLQFSTRDLRNPAISVDETTSDLLEFQVTSDIRVD